MATLHNPFGNWACAVGALGTGWLCRSRRPWLGLLSALALLQLTNGPQDNENNTQREPESARSLQKSCEKARNMISS